MRKTIYPSYLRFVGDNMADNIRVEILETALSLEKAYEFVKDPAHGAIDLFVGTVRNHHLGKAVTGLSYDVHPTLAHQIAQEICEEATRQWTGSKVYLSHYKGNQSIGQISVVIAVGSAHREEAFVACRYVIEELKKRVPIWKNEHYQDEENAWLSGSSLARHQNEDLSRRTSACC